MNSFNNHWCQGRDTTNLRDFQIWTHLDFAPHQSCGLGQVPSPLWVHMVTLNHRMGWEEDFPNLRATESEQSVISSWVSIKVWVSC